MVRSAVPSASSLPLVAFRVEGMRFAVPLASAERAVGMVAVRALPGAPGVLLGAINVHGRPVAVVDLRRRLGLAEHEYGLAAHLLVVRTARRRLALVTDEVLGPLHVDAGDVAHPQAVLPGQGPFRGVAALPEGLLFIYDLEVFLTPEEERLVDQALGARH